MYFISLRRSDFYNAVSKTLLLLALSQVDVETFIMPFGVNILRVVIIILFIMSKVFHITILVSVY